jgi:methylthioribulose-1-phosphate dehydratase
MTPTPSVPTFSDLKRSLIDIGQLFYQRQWSVGTSSNYSIRWRAHPLRILITASGKDKRSLTEDDFVVVDNQGRPLEPDQPTPSAETLLHVAALEQPSLGAVLHTHSVWSTLLSDYFFSNGSLILSDYEMLKGLAGIKTHATSVAIKIFDNTQDLAPLTQEVRALLQDSRQPLQYGFLLRGHGLYTWGKDLFSARRHVEILEFLFEVVGRRLSLK